MRRTLGAALAGAVLVLQAGCASGPLKENPVLIHPDHVIPQDNPLYIPQGPMSYAKVFEKCLDVIDDYFEIAYSNRYDGRIETHPMVAPGLEQPWKPGSPDFYQRLLAFFQTIRHRAIVLISTADDGGYYIEVTILKELEDLPVPVRSTAGSASFRINSTIETQFEVIQPTVYEPNWIPIGRDVKLEQVILERLSQCNWNDVPRPRPVNVP
jgi:hypothetical protein